MVSTQPFMWPFSGVCPENSPLLPNLKENAKPSNFTAQQRLSITSSLLGLKFRPCVWRHPWVSSYKNRTKNDSFWSIFYVKVYQGNGQTPTLQLCAFVDPSDSQQSREEIHQVWGNQIPAYPSFLLFCGLWVNITGTLKEVHAIFVCSSDTSYSCNCHRPSYKCFSDVDPVLLLDNTGPTSRGGSLSPLRDLKSIVFIYDGISCLPCEFWVRAVPTLHSGRI